jgi:hypothetical protein
MESPAKLSGRETSHIADARQSGPKAERQLPVSALEVTDVVRYGMGRGSRIDLTIVSAGHRVRLTGLPAKHVLSYSRIEKTAIEEGLVLPYHRSANRAWRKVLSRAMEHARVEPWLEGEEIAEAIATEIRALLGGGPRGEGASDLMEGKVVEQGDHLLVSPTALVRSVRRRLVDDVLPQATIAEAARARLGMRESRPRFGDARPRAWAFPLVLAAAGENREAGKRRLDRRVPSKPVEGREALGEAREQTERGVGAKELDRSWTEEPASHLHYQRRMRADPRDGEKWSSARIGPWTEEPGRISPSTRDTAGSGTARIEFRADPSMDAVPFDITMDRDARWTESIANDRRGGDRRYFRDLGSKAFDER